ncbi:hypothetical protein ACROYT_G005543 [Oculina patagonica]
MCIYKEISTVTRNRITLWQEPLHRGSLSNRETPGTRVLPAVVNTRSLYKSYCCWLSYFDLWYSKFPLHCKLQEFF